MRLTAMADTFRRQTNNPTFKEVSFEGQFGMPVDIEYNSRKANRLKRSYEATGCDLEIARSDGNYKKVMAKYTNTISQ